MRNALIVAALAAVLFLLGAGSAVAQLSSVALAEDMVSRATEQASVRDALLRGDGPAAVRLCRPVYRLDGRIERGLNIDLAYRPRTGGPTLLAALLARRDDYVGPGGLEVLSKHLSYPDQALVAPAASIEASAPAAQPALTGAQGADAPTWGQHDPRFPAVPPVWLPTAEPATPATPPASPTARVWHSAWDDQAGFYPPGPPTGYVAAVAR